MSIIPSRHEAGSTGPETNEVSKSIKLSISVLVGLHVNRGRFLRPVGRDS